MKIKRDAFLYLEPAEPSPDFAQCETCRMFRENRCAIMGDTEVDADDSCGFYLPMVMGKGKSEEPQRANVTPEEAGLVSREVRCENCISFDGRSTCILFATLNREMPETFDLNATVKPQGCCNAQRNRTP